jgi:hypothetical protein
MLGSIAVYDVSQALRTGTGLKTRQLLSSHIFSLVDFAQNCFHCIIYRFTSQRFAAWRGFVYHKRVPLVLCWSTKILLLLQVVVMMV